MNHGKYFRLDRTAWQVVALILLNGIEASAQQSTWNTNSDGDFLNSANWSNGVPTSSVEAVFSRGAGVEFAVSLPSVVTTPTYAGPVVVESNEVTFSSLGPSAEFQTGGLDVGRDLTNAIFSTELFRFEAGLVTVGSAPGSHGIVNIGRADAALSILTIYSEFIVGRYGTGVLNVSSGGWANSAVNDSDAVFGRYVGGSGTAHITTPDANLLVNTLKLGYGGQGNLFVAGGGLVQCLSYSTLGLISGGVGKAHVTGAGTEWRNFSSLTVGNRGQGELTIDDGGKVTSNRAFIAYDTGSGYVSVDGEGSLWDVLYELNVGYGGVGRLSVTNDGVVEAASITIGELGEISGNALLNSKVVNHGLVAPNGPGPLAITGNYQQKEAGQLLLELGSAVTYGRLQVAASATLAGTLKVEIVDDFIPVAGQSFDILDFTSVTGQFTTLDLPQLADGLKWDASNLYTTGVLAVNPVLSADLDRNGVVDAADLSQWQGDFGVNAMSDADDDSDTDGADFLHWQRQFGGPSLMFAAANAVPEPRGMLLIGTAATLLATRRR